MRQNPTRCGAWRGPVALVLAGWLALAGAGATRAWAQTASQPGTQPAAASTQPGPTIALTSIEPTPEEIRHVELRLGELTKAENLSPQDQQRLKLYTSARELLDKRARLLAEASRFLAEANQAPEQILRLQQAASQPATQPQEAVPTDLAIAEMELAVKQLQAEAKSAKDRSEELAQALKAEQEIRESSRTRIPEVDAELKRVSAELEAAGPAADSNQPLSDQHRLLRFQRAALKAELEYYRAHDATWGLRDEWLRSLQADQLRRVRQADRRLAAWSEALATRKTQQAASRVAEARQAETQAADKPEFLRQIARVNRQLAELGTDIHEKKRQADQAFKSIEKNQKDLADYYEQIRKMVQEVGLTNAIGQRLREQRDALPNLREHRRRSDARQEETARLRERLFEFHKLTGELDDLDGLARRLVQSAAAPADSNQFASLLEQTRAYLHDRQQTLQTLVRDYDEYITTLVKLDTAERRLLALGEQFARYIDERLLWIRSTHPLGRRDLAALGRALLWLTRGENWADLLRAFGDDLRNHLLPYALALAAVAGRLAVGRRTRRLLRGINRRVARDYPGGFGDTVLALLLIGGLSAVGPAVLALVGWRLAQLQAGTGFAIAIGQGLIVAAVIWLPIPIFRLVCRADGLGIAHFRWPADASRRAGRRLRTLFALALPLVLLIAALEAAEDRSYPESLGRVLLIAVLLLLAGVSATLFRPGGAVVQQALGRRKSSWIYRARVVWYPLLIAVPVSLAMATAAGYHYTALQIARRLLVQLWIILLLILAHSLLVRGLLIARRQLALRNAARRRRSKTDPQGASPGPSAPAGDPDPPEVDLSAVHLQTRQLTRYLMATLLGLSLWAVWAGVLPALGILRHLGLWNVSKDGALEAITLADLLLAILVIALTIVVSRNILGVLEVTVLQRMQVEAGARYAVGALARYLIWVIGVVTSLHLLGLGWSQVQWLVAAMTVGLGFGLQEIFANFVSGLILLFERPIRVGDVVTVGGISGTVTRIRIRATTICDWDRKELVVPNKEFITGQLVNWTLSDNIIRIVIPVGIAYGSDTALAARLLLEVAQGNRRVIAEPPPSSLFTGFGDSSLNFELRAFVSGTDNYLPARHELLMAIDQAFRAAHIEIAFPQQDIHIRSAPPAAVPLPPPGAAEARAVDPPKGI